MDALEEVRKPIGEVLDGAGFDIFALPSGWMPLEGVVLVKCLDDEGDLTWAFRTTAGLTDEELLGALVTRTELCRIDTVHTYLCGRSDDDEDDEDD
jgi:hypothetical protein